MSIKFLCICERIPCECYTLKDRRLADQVLNNVLHDLVLNIIFPISYSKLRFYEKQR